MSFHYTYDDGSLSTSGKVYGNDENNARKRIIRVLETKYDTNIDEDALMLE